MLQPPARGAVARADRYHRAGHEGRGPEPVSGHAPELLHPQQGAGGHARAARMPGQPPAPAPHQGQR